MQENLRYRNSGKIIISTDQPISSLITSGTDEILSTAPTFAPQNTSPFSVSPRTALIRASVMQYGAAAGSQELMQR